MDQMVIEYIKELFGIDYASDEDIMKFLLDPQEKGGLELMLAGQYYDIMKVR